MSPVSFCVIIILQIGSVSALSWTDNATHLTACEHSDIVLRWEYKIEPGEYVKAKTWFTGMNKTAKRIAYWKDTDGVTVESDYISRIKMLGNGSFVLSDVRARDEGLYTMIASMPHSSDPDPRRTLNLTIYIAPLKVEGCCKPEIGVRDGMLVAFLASYQGCGKPPPSLTWVEHRNKTVQNSSLYLGETDREGRYKVCITGPAINNCFPDDKEILCRTHDEIRNQTAHYVWQEGTATRSEIIAIPTTLGAVSLIVIIILILVLWKRKKGPLMKAKRKTGKRSRELASLLYEISDLTFLTRRLIDFYETVLPTSNDDSDVQYEMEIIEEDGTQSDKFNASLYEDILCKNGSTFNRILLQGDAGCGKKTWCYSFIRTWCQAKALSEDKATIKHANIDFMSRFKLFFSVSLRDVTEEKDIDEVFKRQHIPNFNSFQGDIYTYLKTHSDVIFLIHGLDEYNGNAHVVRELLGDERLEKALIIFTSRPMTENMFKKKFNMAWPFRRTVTIKGLDKKDLLKRAGEILKEDGHPTKSLDNFSLLVERKGLGNFMQEPIFFPSLISMWQNSGTLPSCKAEFMLNVLENQIKKKRNSFLPYRDKTDYYYDFNENSKLTGKVFICHYGLILRFLGKIAMELQRDKTNIFGSVQFEEDNYRNFCVKVDLICTSQVSANDHSEDKFSFRHRSMQLFLAALYIISRPVLEDISAMWSGAGGENLADTRNPENMDDYRDSADAKGNKEYCEFSDYVSYLCLID